MDDEFGKELEVVVSLIRDTLPEFVWVAKDNYEQSLSKAGFRPDVWTRVLPNANQELYPEFCVLHSAEEYLYGSIPFLKKTCFLTRVQFAVSDLRMVKSGKEKHPNLSYCKLGQLIHRCLPTWTAGRSGLFFLLEKTVIFFFQFVDSSY